MKVLIINTYDTGGAANACIRLHQGLLNQKIDSNLLLLHKTKDLQNSHQFNRKKPKSLPFFLKMKRGLANKLNISKPKLSEEELFLRQRERSLEMYSFPNSNHNITQSKLYQEADIINLHWVAGFLDFESFFKKNTKPVVWTLHDMNPFLGGEHYKEINHGITSLGTPRKRNISDVEKFLSRKNLKLKISVLSKVENLTIVSPSVWLKAEAQSSELFKNRIIQVIPYGLNTKLFTIRNPKFGRELFNIPSHKKVILFVADSIQNNRKGYIYLKRALENLNSSDVILCSLGKGAPKFDSHLEMMHLGHINDDRFLSVVYSLADVFVIPSLMDNLPNTVLESLLCGTPVIGFPIGGIRDMISQGNNGILTSEVSVNSLQNTIEIFLFQKVKWSKEKIREQAVLNYDQSVQAKKYIDLYTEIINASNYS